MEEKLLTDKNDNIAAAKKQWQQEQQQVINDHFWNIPVLEGIWKQLTAI